VMSRNKMPGLGKSGTLRINALRSSLVIQVSSNQTPLASRDAKGAGAI
jgi:hypothetical protein